MLAFSVYLLRRDNELTRGYVHPEYSVKKMKILNREIENGDCFKIVNFRFLWFLDCNIWFRDMHARLYFFYPARPGPVRSEAKVCSCATVCMCYRSRQPVARGTNLVPTCGPRVTGWFPTCGQRAKHVASRLQRVVLQTSKSGPRPPKDFKNICATTAKFTFGQGMPVGYKPLCPLWWN